MIKVATEVATELSNEVGPVIKVATGTGMVTEISTKSSVCPDTLIYSQVGTKKDIGIKWLRG